MFLLLDTQDIMMSFWLDGYHGFEESHWFGTF